MAIRISDYRRLLTSSMSERMFDMKIKHQLIPLLTVILISTAANAGWLDSPRPAPDWFNTPPSGTKGNEYYGTGKGDDEKEARKNAMEAICSSIRSDVASGFYSQEEVKNDGFSQQKRHDLRVQTDCSLTDAEVIKQQRVDNAWYVLMRYENSTLGKKCKTLLSPSECAGEKQNRYLEKTRLFQEINAEMGCTPDMRLERRHGIWYLIHRRIKQLLPLTAADMANLIAPVKSNTISVTPSNTELREGTVFSFTVQSRQDGFVTLFDVYENGEVFVVEPNQKIKANQKIMIPDPKSESELVAGVLTPGKPSTDLYVAVYSDNQGVFSSLQRLGQQIAKDEDHFKFDELLMLLDRYEFSATVVKTTPKPAR